MTLSELKPGDRFRADPATCSRAMADIEFERGQPMAGDICCQRRDAEGGALFLSPDLAVIVTSRIAERRIASQEPDAECDPMLGGA